MKIIITMDIDVEFADSEHETGLTEEGYDLILRKLAPYGDDIDIRREMSV